MIEPSFEIRDVTSDLDACLNVAQVVGSCIAISESPFDSGREFKNRIKPSLVLGAYHADEVIGGLIAKDFGKRLQTMMADMRYAYRQGEALSMKYDVQSWLQPEPADYFRPRPPARHGMVVEYLGVRYDQRGNGAGKLLMEHAIEFAKAQGSEEVKLQQTPHAATLYDRLGFEPRGKHEFYRRLPLNDTQ